ncbi:MAG: hypothetical protein A2Z14_05780 [Chloroflexi bacterium RBG_16_48_8]|nr:MAG: hypothetical protein A2Z14_05780 [Chloroflexi bacterium RBG_16_48_8]
MGKERSWHHTFAPLRWLIILPVIFLLISISSELALAIGFQLETAGLRSNLYADYRPWKMLTLPRVEDGIIEEIRKDLEHSGYSTEDTLARLSDPIEHPGEFLQTEGNKSDHSSTPLMPNEHEDQQTALPIATSTPRSDNPLEATGTETKPSPLTETHTPTWAHTSTPTRTPSPSSTSTPAKIETSTATSSPTPTSSPSPSQTPALCQSWYDFHSHDGWGAENYIGMVVHEGHGWPDGPALDRVVLFEVRVQQVDVDVVERIEKLEVGHPPNPIITIPWQKETSEDVTIPVGIDLVYCYPGYCSDTYRASYATAYFRGNISGTYVITSTIYIPQYDKTCSIERTITTD